MRKIEDLIEITELRMVSYLGEFLGIRWTTIKDFVTFLSEHILEHAHKLSPTTTDLELTY